MQLKKTHIGKQFLFTDEVSLVETKEAYAILIKAYAETEVEIWGENYTRIELAEFQKLADKNELIIAKCDDSVVGTIHFSKIDTDSYSFGLFAADPAYKGMGIGRNLIDLVEKIAFDNGAKFMNLEILRPTNFHVPIKTILHEWYVSLGYVFTHTSTFLEHKPDKVEKAKELILPASFDCFQKALN